MVDVSKSTDERRLVESITINAARVIHGSSRGKKLGVPTINIDPSSVPTELRHGIYACRLMIGNDEYKGAMHYGPRPVFKDSDSCEVHVLDTMIDKVPPTISIDVVAWIRAVQDFPTVEALMQQIEQDIKTVRATLAMEERE